MHSYLHKKIILVKSGCYTLSLLVYYIYIYIYRHNYQRLGEHTVVLWNLLNGVPSHSAPLLGPSESMRGGTPGTNPRHHTTTTPEVIPQIKLRANPYEASHRFVKATRYM
jgi:hypothetical protein